MGLGPKFEESLERDERAMERIASAFESISETLTAWHKLDQARFEKEYPVKPEPTDASVTVPKTEQQKLEDSLGQHDPVVTEWIGQRERELLDKHPELDEGAPSKPVP